MYNSECMKVTSSFYRVLEKLLYTKLLNKFYTAHPAIFTGGYSDLDGIRTLIPSFGKAFIK
jgi:hypothetical protein